MSDGTTIRVITANLWESGHDEHDDPAKRGKYVCWERFTAQGDKLAELSPDLACLQELGLLDLHGQRRVHALARKLGMLALFMHSRDAGGHMAILYRPGPNLFAVNPVRFEPDGGRTGSYFHAGLCQAQLEHPALPAPLTVANVHFSWASPELRAAEARRTADLSNITGQAAYSIVAGDINAARHHEYPPLEGRDRVSKAVAGDPNSHDTMATDILALNAGFVSAVVAGNPELAEVSTGTGKNMAQDDILVPPSLADTPVHAEVIDTGDLSDHQWVLADLDLDLHDPHPFRSNV
jgi:endonuclease/exonuclease/phosphatase family metal-dependent hydrolase